MIRAVIIDDEKHSRESTEMLVEDLPMQIEIVGMAANAITGAKLVIESNPDLIFLDIQMPEKSGIELLDMIPDYRGEIIFITAYDQYAIEAFKKGALHYLLKPVDPYELLDAVKRAKEKIIPREKSPTGNWMSLSTQEGWIVIKKEDIIRLESYKNYTTIYTTKGKHTVSKTMKDVELSLDDNAFYRVHNSNIIHIKYISKVLKTDGGNILMSNEDLVPISKWRKKEFLQWFHERIHNV